jgi:pyruvate dehydrogenase E2 component (dihydrolipoamide acetyltransferase)
MRNLPLTPLSEQSSFRRIAAAAWPEPRDPHVYGSMEIRSEALEAWVEAQRAATGERVTVTHAVARALGIVLGRHRDINAIVRFGRLEQRRDVDVFVQVAVEGAEGKAATADLSGLKVCQVDRKDVGSIAREVRERAARIRAHQDPDFEKTKKLLTVLPGWLLRWMLSFVTFVSYTLNINPSFLGSPPDPFGSAMLTNVGVFGLTVGYAPFLPLARCALIVTLGAIETRPVVENGQLAVGRVLHLNGTFDHRIIDGLHVGILARELKDLLEHPEKLAGD